MGIFDTALENIKRAKSIRDAGGVIGIPFGLPSLDRHVPGVIKGIQYLISASSGV